jgi:dipeptidyl aminopeptidase/acylaminoacyl peptidase
MERAPFFFTASSIERAFQLAEQQAGFQVSAAAPVAAAPRIKAPVLLIHGDVDRKTPLAHSRRVFAALSGPKRLLVVPGAGHTESLNGREVWLEIDRWIDSYVQQITGEPEFRSKK